MTRLTSRQVTRSATPATTLNSLQSMTTSQRSQPITSPAAAQPQTYALPAAADRGQTAVANNSRSSFGTPNTDQQNSVPTNRPAPAAFQSGYAAVNLRYTESSPIHVRGPITGRSYKFSGADPVQPVDVRDAGLLLSARFFRSL
jgi:hypothetical protein